MNTRAKDFSLDDAQISDDVSETVERMPEVSEHFTPPATEAAAASAPAGELDADGVAWNSEVHATGKDGKGVKTASGTWRRRRKSKVSTGAEPTTEQPAPLLNGMTPEQVQQARAAGIVAAQSVFIFGRILGGDEWAPTNDENNMMTQAWGEYFIAKGVTNFPPSMLLFMAIGSYAAPRFVQPETQSRLSRLKGWIAGKWIRFRDRRKSKHTRGSIQRATESAVSSMEAHEARRGRPVDE